MTNKCALKQHLPQMTKDFSTPGDIELLFRRASNHALVLSDFQASVSNRNFGIILAKIPFIVEFKRALTSKTLHKRRFSILHT